MITDQPASHSSPVFSLQDSHTNQQLSVLKPETGLISSASNYSHTITTICTLENCLICSQLNNVEVCHLCYGVSIGKNNINQCQKCTVENCYQCISDNTVCELCYDGNPPTNGICDTSVTTCIDENCLYCPNSPSICAICKVGYFSAKSCISCFSIHKDCKVCAHGLCTTCAKTPTTEVSVCMACDILGCQDCKLFYNERKLIYSKQCLHCYNGYMLMEANSLCIVFSETSCSIPNCKKCTTTEPIACLECDPLYYFYNERCFPCAIPNCLNCEITELNGKMFETCRLCNEGFVFLMHQQHSAPGALCIPESNQVFQTIKPTIFIVSFFILLGLTSVMVGFVVLYHLIEEKDTNERQSLAVPSDDD